MPQRKTSLTVRKRYRGDALKDVIVLNECGTARHVKTGGQKYEKHEHTPRKAASVLPGGHKCEPRRKSEPEGKTENRSSRLSKEDQHRLNSSECKQ
jgi:hypothetical protein